MLGRHDEGVEVSDLLFADDTLVLFYFMFLISKKNEYIQEESRQSGDKGRVQGNITRSPKRPHRTPEKKASSNKTHKNNQRRGCSHLNNP